MVRRERDMGGRLMRDMKRRRRTTLLKAESVRPGMVRISGVFFVIEGGTPGVKNGGCGTYGPGNDRA